MKGLLKYCGVILLLIGVVVECIYFWGPRSNALLAVAAVCIVLGCIAHIVINKYFTD